MPAVTDLTWSQLNDGLKQLLASNSDLVTIDAYGIPTNINVSAIVGGISNNLADPTSTQGVIKFITRLCDACRIAQETVNQGKATGEKLTAFGAATAAAPRGALVPITRSLTTQADLATATRIVGTNA